MTEETMIEMERLYGQLTAGLYARQVLALCVLFLAGLCLVRLLGKGMSGLWSCLLACPTGAALYAVLGFVLLTLGIPMNRVSLGAGALFVLFFAWLYGRRDTRAPLSPWLLLSALALILAAAALPVPLSVSNDSYYYYTYYPSLIAGAGEYRKEMEVFLSDVGPMAAVIGTLPQLFGFYSNFGLQQLLSLNFILLFLMAVYEQSAARLSRRTALALSALASGLLLVTTPYAATAGWMLANLYMMLYMFLVFYQGMTMGAKKRTAGELLLLALWMAVISMLRMEGAILALVLVLCLSCLDYSNRELLCAGTLPMVAAQLLYYGKYFIGLKADPLYSFLDIKKAGVAVAAQLVLAAYFCFIRRKRLLYLQKNMPLTIVCALLAGNLLLLLVSPAHYLANMKAFFFNIAYQQGWGYSVLLLLCCYLLLPGRACGGKTGYVDVFPISFVLFAVAVCFARGSSLRQGIGDSGNRVMMQVVPCVIFALSMKAVNLAADWERSREDGNATDRER